MNIVISIEHPAWAHQFKYIIAELMERGDNVRNCREIICIFLESMLIYVMNEFSDSGGHFHGT